MSKRGIRCRSKPGGWPRIHSRMACVVVKSALFVSLSVYGLAAAQVAKPGADWDALIARTKKFASDDRPSEAAKVASEALLVAEERFGPSHVRTGISALFLARAEFSTGDLHQAAFHYERALSAFERHAKSMNRLLGATALELAVTYLKLEQPIAAVKCLERSIKVLQQTLGPDHPDITQSQNLLAETYSRLSKYDKVLPLRLSILSRQERTLGPGHIETAQGLDNLAITYVALGRLHEAAVFQARALEIRDQALGPENSETLRSVEQLADTYSSLGRYANALPLRVRALATIERSVGSKHPKFASSLNDLAANYVELSEFERALALQTQALTITEHALGSTHPATARSLNDLALTHSELGQYDKSLPLYLRALAIREVVPGPDSRETALSLNNLAALYRLMNRPDEALPLQIRALAIQGQTLGLKSKEMAYGLNNLAAIYAAMNRFADALPLLLQASSVLTEVLGPDHPTTVSCLANLADIYWRLGQYDNALQLQRRLQKLADEVSGTDSKRAADLLMSLGYTSSDLGQYGDALRLQERALAIRESTLGPSHLKTLETLDALALTHWSLAQYEVALRLQRRVLEAHESRHEDDSVDVARTLNNLALTYSSLGKYELALPLYERAVAVFKKRDSIDSLGAASVISNLAENYRLLGIFDFSVQLNQRALAIREGLLGPEHPDNATSLNSLAIAYVELGSYERALPLQHRAWSLLTRAFGVDHPKVAQVIANLGHLHSKTGDKALSISLLKEAVNTYQGVRERVSRIGVAELRTYTESISSTYQQLASLLTDLGRLPEAQVVLDMLKEDEQFDFIRRSSIADPRRTRVGYSSTEQRWMIRYREIADRLAALGKEEEMLKKQARVGLSDAQKTRQASLVGDLNVAQTAFESFLTEMRENLARAGPGRSVEWVESSVKALAEMRGLINSLGDGVVLLQVYVTDEQVNLLLTTPGVQLARTTKIKSRDLNRQIAEFRRVLRDPKSNPLPASQALYKLLIEPIAQDLEQAGAKTVMLSLDGALRYVPFGALHDGQRYAMQRWSLPIYTSVARERLRDAVAPQWQAAGLGLTLKVGDFDPLPAVKAELSSIIRTGTSGVLPGEIHLDKAFTAQRLRDVSQRQFPVLHVASHFRFSPGTEVNSFLLLGDGQQLTLGDIRTQNFRFDNADLLTLSACDTGLGGGRDELGREIEGFGVIAQQQGAKAVLATLWPVADQSTATLMAEMYRRREGQKLSKIEALRQAQSTLLEQPRYSHPFYWAPFILMGNWR